MDSAMIDQEWLDLWQTEERLKQSASFYSLRPIDEEFQWSRFDQQPVPRHRRRSSINLPSIKENTPYYVHQVQ